jgi:cobalt/nickel transport system permease protein
MHIPDGFLDAKTAGVTTALSAVAVSAALHRLRKTLPRRKIPFMGLAAAFLFAAQMVNFPVGGGTSGHLLGGVLCAVVLGPAEALIVVTSVLIVQCFLFADGGLTALGANIFNMGIIGAVMGYGLFRILAAVMPGERWRMAALALAAWCSTVLAAVCCTGELAWSGTVAWNAAIVPMAAVHMLIGIGESVITLLVVKVVSSTRPDILSFREGTGGKYGMVIILGMVTALGLAVFVAPFASQLPDGLEAVAGWLGFGNRALDTLPVSGPFAGYSLHTIASPHVATAVSGAAGTVLMFFVGYFVVRLVARRGSAVEREKEAGNAP